MDVYIPEVQNEQQACLMFVFGGGFIGGKRDDNQIQQVWRHFTEKGYVVIAIDYRLGMRGKTEFAALKALKNFQKSIDMAAEDVISALDYTIRNLRQTEKFTLDCAHIVVMGSAGTVGVSLLYRSLKRRVPADCQLVLMMCLWLAAFAVVGCQLGWIMRPLVGSPNISVEFLRSDALDSNFLESLFTQIIPHLINGGVVK